ncbi:MAG: protein adenylyltransferase SelO, partial [Flavicella sp.]
SFTDELPADPDHENARRQVTESCYSFVTPKKTKSPELIHASREIAADLGLSEGDILSKTFLQYFTGNKQIPNTNPYAMCYGGHQFGNWAGQLGDGRAINLTEIESKGKQWTLQLKGAGETPYSRTADGLAVLRSSVREYLCSEAMFHLGIPTTRALSLALTGDKVLRDILYNGNQAYEKGAIVCRVAPSFLRFGNYELPASRGDNATLKKLVDYTIIHHFKELGTPSKETYISFFKEVSNKTLKTIIEWQRVGFVHGVMNTDNLSILGLTIDYGPYGWLEGYNHNWTPNTTDSQHKRYRYANQPNIGLWNLLKLANALYPLVNEVKPFEEILENYKVQFDLQYHTMYCNKLGLKINNHEDKQLIASLEDALHLTETDMTLFFRNLSKLKKSDTAENCLLKIQDAFYVAKEVKENTKETWLKWFQNYTQRLLLEKESDEERQKAMNLVNPKYVLRNYMAQIAIEAADKGDYSVVEELYQLLKKPYDEQQNSEKWFVKRPDWARNKVGCSMLSCSS